MKLNKQKTALALLAVTTLWGCAPTEEEKKQKEEEEKNRPSISLQSVGTITEPVNGATSFPTTVSLSKTAAAKVTVQYAITPLTASGGSDFEVKTGLIEIPAGTLNADIDVTVYGDNVDENDEKFIISLSSPTNANMGNASQVITIMDYGLDSTMLSFETDRAQVAEGSGLYRIKIILSTRSEKVIKIPFTIAGLASQGQDFNIKTASPITVPAKAKEVEILLEFIPDTIPEGGESVVLDLQTPENAELGEHTKLTLTIPGDVGLNDTGVLSWYDGTDFKGISANSQYPGQDAKFGRDTENFELSDGPAAFSFTKIDKDGNKLSSNSMNARCVLDNRTGLVFELKQGKQLTLPTLGGEALKSHLQDEIDNGLNSYSSAHANWRANNFRYYWYDDNTATNGEGSGAPGGQFVNEARPISTICAFPDESMVSYSKSHNSCNTKVYKDAFNGFAMCGFQDWKLPTIEQLRSIYNYRAIAAPVDEVNFFPNTIDGDYISSTSSADGSGAAWCMSSTTGQVRLCNKHLPNYVRLVRGGAE